MPRVLFHSKILTALFLFTFVVSFGCRGERPHPQRSVDQLVEARRDANPAPHEPTSVDPISPSACEDLRLIATASQIAASQGRAPKTDLPDSCPRVAECSCEQLNAFIVAAQDAHCQASDHCRRLGQCTAAAGRCVATSAEDCRRSENCRELGACTPRDDRCALTSSDDCAKTQACSLQGACALPPDQDARSRPCQPTKAEHCLQSQACRNDGRCQLEEVRVAVGDGAEHANYCASPAAVATDAARSSVRAAWHFASSPALRHALSSGGKLTGARRVIEELAFNEFGLVEHVERAHVRATLQLGEHREFTYRVPCPAFIELARELLPASRFESKDARLEFRPWLVEWNGRPVLDAGERACRNPDSLRWRFLSWVGPLLSYDRSSSGHIGPRTSWSVERQTIDVRTGEQVPLDYLVETASVVQAIKRDTWVTARLAELRRNPPTNDTELAGHLRAFDDAKTLDALLPALHELLRRARSGYLPRYSNGEPAAGMPFEGYAFTTYDPQNNRVAMRVAIPHYELSNQFAHVILGLWVTPRPQFVADFESAARDGHLLGDFAPDSSRFLVPTLEPPGDGW